MLRNPTLIDYARLFCIAGIWGATFLFNEVALIDFPPIAVAAYRITLAALLLSLLCYWRGLQIRINLRAFKLLVAIGILNSVVPFSLIGWGQLRIDSATTAILLSTSPFVTLLLSHFLTQDDRFSWYKLLGLVFGFSGVLVLLAHGMQQGQGSVAGMLAVVLSACCYSLSSLLIRRLGSMPSLLLVAGSLTAGALLLLPISLWLYPPWTQAYHAPSLTALLILGVAPTAIAYVLRAQIVQINGAVFMSNAGYLIPLFAVLWGWLFLSQQPSGSMWLSLVLILIGVGLGQRRKSN